MLEDCKADLLVNSLRQTSTQDLSFLMLENSKFDCEKGLKLSKTVDENLIVSDY